MTRDEIVTALRCCDGGEYDECNKCPLRDGINCRNLLDLAAADLIENQQRHIEALMKANDSLKNAIARRDKQIEDMKQGMAQLLVTGRDLDVQLLTQKVDVPLIVPEDKAEMMSLKPENIADDGAAVCKETGAFIVPEGWKEGSIELD